MEPIEKWSTDALCQGMALEAFHAHKQSRRYIEENLPCSGCPVYKDCEDYAIIYDEYGIWGGKSRQERRKEANEFVSPGITYREHLVFQAVDLQILEVDRVPRDDVLRDYLLSRIAKKFRLENQKVEGLESLLAEVNQLSLELEALLPSEPRETPTAHPAVYEDSNEDPNFLNNRTYTLLNTA